MRAFFRLPLSICKASEPIFAWWTRAFAQVDDDPKTDPVILTDEQEEYALRLHLEFLEDASRQLTNEGVHSNSPSGLVQADLQILMLFLRPDELLPGDTQ